MFTLRGMLMRDILPILTEVEFYMHILQVLSCPSPALGTSVPVAVLLPPDHAISNQRYAVLTLLHGLSDTFMCWLDYTNLRRYVADLRLIVVMPQCGRSFYINTVDGRRVEDFIVADLQTFIDSHYATIATRESRAIGGISMGGYGALMLALRHRTIWGAAFSHSGAVGAPRWVEDPPNMMVFGPFGNAVRRDHDLFHLIEDSTLPMPQLHIDCGIEDFLVDENRAFHRMLQEHHIPHIYREHPGGHSWRYCDENLSSSLIWVCRQLQGHCDPRLDGPRDM